MNQLEAIEKMRGVIRRQHKSLATEDCYCGWLKRYCFYVRSLPDQSLTSERKLEKFLTHLAQDRDVSASTQNQAFNSICFFYKDVMGTPLKEVDALRATRPEQIRHAPTIPETQKLLHAVPNLGGYPTNLVARIMYGAGLRVGEPIAFRVKDVRLDDGTIFIHGGKGRKDRVVRLPCSVVPELEQQLLYAKSVFNRDCKVKIPIALPHQLARKYPEYQFNFQWAWIFPQKNPCQDPRSGKVVRWHLLPSMVQRAVKAARRITGIMVLPHELRHAYATHNLDRGVNIKSLQEAMGHKNIETTIGYCHATALSVPSPLEVLK